MQALRRRHRGGRHRHRRAKAEAPSAEPDKAEAPKPEPKKAEAPKPEPKKAEAPKPEPKKAEAPKPEPKKAEAPKPEPKKAEAPKPEPKKAEAPKPEPKKAEAPKPEPKKAEAPKPEPKKAEAPKPEPKKAEAPKPEPKKAEAPKLEPKPEPKVVASKQVGGGFKALDDRPSGWHEPGASGVPGARARRPHAAKQTLLGGLGGPGADEEPSPPAPRAAQPAATPKPAAVEPPRPEAVPRPTAAGAAPRRVSAAKRTMIGIPAPAVESPEPEPAVPPMAPVAVDEPAATSEAGGGPEWTVAITDDQHEELNTNEVVELYARGAVDQETFIWADGMEDWKQPWEIPLIAAALSARGLAPLPEEPDDEDRTIVSDGLPSSRPSGGEWREPGSWSSPSLDGPIDDDAVSFDDVTVSMDAPRAAELLREARLMDDAVRATQDLAAPWMSESTS